MSERNEAHLLEERLLFGSAGLEPVRLEELRLQLELSFYYIVFLSSTALANFDNTPAQKLELAGYSGSVDYTSYYTRVHYIHQPFVITSTIINVIISYAKFEMDTRNGTCAS